MGLLYGETPNKHEWENIVRRSRLQELIRCLVSMERDYPQTDVCKDLHRHLIPMVSCAEEIVDQLKWLTSRVT